MPVYYRLQPLRHLTNSFINELLTDPCPSINDQLSQTSIIPMKKLSNMLFDQHPTIFNDRQIMGSGTVEIMIQTVV